MRKPNESNQPESGVQGNPYESRPVSPSEAKSSEIPALRVLVVNDDAALSTKIATMIRDKYSIDVAQAPSPEEASKAIRAQEFDIVFFGHPAWEEGVLLYIDMLDARKSACQCILFMDDPSEVEPHFEGYLKVVAKPHWEELIAAADWTGHQSRIEHGRA